MKQNVRVFLIHALLAFSYIPTSKDSKKGGNQESLKIISPPPQQCLLLLEDS